MPQEISPEPAAPVRSARLLAILTAVLWTGLLTAVVLFCNGLRVALWQQEVERTLLAEESAAQVLKSKVFTLYEQPDDPYAQLIVRELDQMREHQRPPNVSQLKEYAPLEYAPIVPIVEKRCGALLSIDEEFSTLESERGQLDLERRSLSLGQAQVRAGMLDLFDYVKGDSADNPSASAPDSASSEGEKVSGGTPVASGTTTATVYRGGVLEGLPVVDGVSDYLQTFTDLWKETGAPAAEQSEIADKVEKLKQEAARLGQKESDIAEQAKHIEEREDELEHQWEGREATCRAFLAHAVAVRHSPPVSFGARTAYRTARVSLASIGWSPPELYDPL